MSPEIVMAQAPSTAPPFEGLHGPESPPSSGTDGSNAVEATAGRRKANLRYQHGYLYENHGAWFVRYRQRDESGNVVYAAKHLGCCKDFFDIAEVGQCRAQFMQTINRDRLNANSRITLATFVEGAYLPWTKEERRASTSKGHHEIWRNYLRERVGNLRVREFRTVDASRLLRAIAKERDLTRTTLQHIKSVLSAIFIYAKNEGVFDGANPVDGALVPRNAREPGQSHTYDLSQVSQILKVLPLQAKSLVATAALAGLRRGELRGLQWSDYTTTSLSINRSIWRSVVNLPKTRASRASVPVIRSLAVILEEYRGAMGYPRAGVIFHENDGLPINLDSFTRKVIQPVLQANRIPWYGWHAFRRSLASNLYATGAQDILVQRILRHAKAHVTRDCYIKVFDSTVSSAMHRLQVQFEQLEESKQESRQLEFEFAECIDQGIAITKSQARGGFSDLLGG
jgi:integrase